MVKTDETLLICDFAETYHVLDWRGLPLTLAASLAFGLRESSRIKTKISGSLVDFNTLLNAAMLDCLSFLVWAKTEDAQKGRNRPKSVYDALSGEVEKLTRFYSTKTFEKALLKIKKKGVES